MLKKMPILLVILSLTFLMTPTCWGAKEKPFGDIVTEQDIIEKAFIGRTPDPVEGIWVCNEQFIIAVVKTPVAYPQGSSFSQYDYLGVSINIDRRPTGEICFALNRTKYPFSFHCKTFSSMFSSDYWKLTTPNTLQFDGTYSSTPTVFVRTYPTL